MKHHPATIGSRNLLILWGICLSGGIWPDVGHAERPLLELTTEKTTVLGQSLVHTPNRVWMQERDGQIRQIPLSEVTSFRRVASQFRPWSAADVRAELRREFGGSKGSEILGLRNELAIVGTGQYLVCGRASDVDRYARVFDNVSRSFRSYCSVRRLGTSEPEFPLVAIVFPGRESFVKYAATRGVRVGGGTLGFYHIESNRIALYDPDDGSLSRAELIDEFRPPLDLQMAAIRDNGLPSDLEGVMIHEATHQLAFNMGLHSRVGSNPQWVVEGLATVFEAPGIRKATGQQPIRSRVNAGRLEWFRDYLKKRRPAKSLEAFLESDVLFQQAPLDAYSQAWALTFFLVETRPREYGDYLRSLANRDPLKPLGSTDRVALIKEAFGKDEHLLEAAFLRFIAQLP